MAVRIAPREIQAAHRLYCELTGQRLAMRYDRERQWYELLREGFTLADLRRVITYLQREIRHDRRNVGALKLSNLLQPDRFEEDLNIATVSLRAPSAPAAPATPPPKPLSPEAEQARRQRALERIRHIRKSLAGR